ncbi:uncharacterized protein LOC143588461 [Bidens hawaiensis]|uniref:uncharacterized protein LOC143588461 n=1 Tax=Bidens hawaiensis TaxID=980011 RepID=UPI00404B574B
MADFQVVGGMKKLNNQNYNTYSTCMSSYLQGQDLWEVVQGSNTTQPRIDTNGAINKWKVKVGKAMFALKTTIEEELLDHKNDAKLQLLENKLLSITQKDLTIPQHFHKVKTLCRDIGELDPEARVGNAKMKRILIHGLRTEYRSFIAAVQGWPKQPSLVEFKNLLASQEDLAKQIGDISISSPKIETEALYADRGKGKFWSSGNQGRKWNDRYKKSDNYKSGQSSNQREAMSDKKLGKSGKRFPYKCYTCGKHGHMSKYFPGKSADERNAATVREEVAWDAEVYFTTEEHVMALTANTETEDNSLDDWIVDSGCSNHMSGEKAKLRNPVKYEGNRVIVIAENSRQKIAHVGDILFKPHKQGEFVLNDVYHVPGVKTNLLSVPQITSTGRYVLFLVQMMSRCSISSKPPSKP